MIIKIVLILSFMFVSLNLFNNIIEWFNSEDVVSKKLYLQLIAAWLFALLALLLALVLFLLMIL